MQVLLLAAADIPLVMGRAEGRWGFSCVGQGQTLPLDTCRASGRSRAWLEPEQVLVGPEALFGDRLWGCQALPQLFTAWRCPVLGNENSERENTIIPSTSGLSSFYTPALPWPQCGSCHCLYCSPDEASMRDTRAPQG